MNIEIVCRNDDGTTYIVHAVMLGDTWSLQRYVERQVDPIIVATGFPTIEAAYRYLAALWSLPT